MIATDVGCASNISAERCVYGRDKLRLLRGIGNIERFGKHFDAVSLPNFFRCGLKSRVVASADSDAAAFGSESFSRGQPDSLTGRGNQGDTIFESQIHESAKPRL